MKIMKKFLSIVMTSILSLSLPLVSYAQSTTPHILSVEENGQVRTATVAADGKTIVAEYNPSTEIVTVTTKDGDKIEEVLHINPNASTYTQDVYIEPHATGIERGEEDGKYRVSYQHTIVNYEYEEWKYPNFLDGKGFFWFFTKPGSEQRDCYEESRGDSELSPSIDGYVEAVEIINDQEIIVGISAAGTLAAIYVSGGSSAVIQAKLTAALEALGIVGAATIVQTFWSATQDCERYWKEIYGV